MAYIGTLPNTIPTGIVTTATGTVLTLSDTSVSNSVNVVLANQKEVRFSETSANGSNFIGVLAPASLSDNFTLTLPAVTDTLVGKTTTDTLTNKTLTAPKIGTSILDTNGNELALLTATGSAVNEFTITNNATGSAPILSATGDDTNIGITLTPKGTGAVTLDQLIFPTGTGTADQILTTDGAGQLSFVDNSGGTSWQAVKTTTYTAVAGEGIFANTTSGAWTLTLPSSPTIGDEVSIVDYAGTFDTNNLTVGRNSQNIQGVAADLTVATERAGFTLAYTDVTQGWLLKNN